ncbi:FMN-binding split barrel [Penicillium macrosclerotiorum]|uniref:FMN-binding split barrel n=1 Tax=Penicillium macrosclerotiorum TaxID=303699 RepID=UPI002547B0DE|nr:FMN-binding split barrel [Penicillium macrosclerotiorum]KAJ5676044.1 FMN-binding split barrel [Penicillium macrosclerotiorum]
MEPATLRRNTHRGTYDIASAKAVFDDCFIAHVSYIDKGLPQCLPMVALVRKEVDETAEDSAENEQGLSDGGEEKQENTVVYLHGHPSTRIIELVREASRETEDVTDQAEGASGRALDPVKVCITATKVDGLALSSAPNGHTFNYRSAVIHGTCTPVKSKAVKRTVIRSVTNHIVANRWEEVNPVASFQISLVYVIKVSIDSLSVKTRTGPPGIQPRNKEVDGPDNETPPWAGVIPLWEQLGEPVDSGLTPGAKVSENLKAYIESRNERHQAYSKRVASE